MKESISKEIERLLGLPLKDLRHEWHQWHPDRVMPDRLPRDLLVRTIAWKLQERAFGGLTGKVGRELTRLSAQLARSGSLDIERETSIKPGTRLLREWRGQTHRVTSLDEGFLYEDRHYASLSEVARTITGTRWSGPRFFGLPQRSGKAHASKAEARRG